MLREDPFIVLRRLLNRRYQLQDMEGKVHKTWVNGWRLQPYHSQVFEEQVSLEQVSLDSDEPLGLIAQDPFLSQHVPCISSMNIGPITRPCIDTLFCDLGTTMDHLSNGREDECTSRLQGNVIIEEAFEQEAWMPLASWGWAKWCGVFASWKAPLISSNECVFVHSVWFLLCFRPLVRPSQQVCEVFRPFVYIRPSYMREFWHNICIGVCICVISLYVHNHELLVEPK